MDNKQRTQRLDEATTGRRLLEHPFYQAWQQGSLTKDDLSFYSTQYWRQVDAFPGYLADLINRMEPGRARDILSANLRDERDGDHPGMWLEFASALGASAENVRATDVEPETQQCVTTFKEACGTGSIPFALGMLYGYESQTPGVAKTKVEGLRERYGVEGKPVRYFELHGDLDVEHSSELAEAIGEVSKTETDFANAEAGAKAGAEAIYTLLDGVARRRSVTVNA